MTKKELLAQLEHYPDTAEIAIEDGKVVAKEKEPQCYEDVANLIFDKGAYRPVEDAESCFSFGECPTHELNCTTSLQAKKLLAINKLMNVYKYLAPNFNACDFENGTPDWEEASKEKWYHYIDQYGTIDVGNGHTHPSGAIYFPSEETAKRALNILGEDCIRLALSTNY